MPLTSSGHDRRKKKKELVGPREQVIVAGAFSLYMVVFVWRLHRDCFRYQLAINQLVVVIPRIDFYFASGFKLIKVVLPQFS